MNEFIVITVIAILTGTLRQCQANNNVDEITALKNTVESVSSDLKIWGSSFISNYASNFSDSRDSEFKNFNTTAKKAYDDSRTYIDAAKKRGKNADHCSETMERQLSDAQRAAYDKMEKCANEGLEYPNKMQSYVDGIITTGKSLISDLDGIPIFCMSLDPMGNDECMSKHMVLAPGWVNRYRELIEQFKSTGDALVVSESTPGAHCFKPAMRDFKFAISIAKILANACIENS